MSERVPPLLRAALAEMASIVRASDTFRLVTTDGAARLANRARERRGTVSEVRKAWSHAVPGDARKDELDALLLHAELEIGSQEKLAAWLLKLGGDA